MFQEQSQGKGSLVGAQMTRSRNGKEPKWGEMQETTTERPMGRSGDHGRILSGGYHALNYNLREPLCCIEKRSEGSESKRGRRPRYYLRGHFRAVVLSLGYPSESPGQLYKTEA